MSYDKKAEMGDETHSKEKECPSLSYEEELARCHKAFCRKKKKRACRKWKRTN
jgi:hypothetical protein